MAHHRISGGAFWLTAAMGLSGLIAYQLSEGLPLTPAVIAASSEAVVDSRTPADPPTVRLPSDDLITAIVGRPLFSPSRRPAAALPQAAELPVEAADRTLGLELVGTMLSGETPVALVRHPVDGLLRLRQGQEVEGWTVTEIKESWVGLDKGDRIEKLSLRKDRIKPAKSSAARKAADIVRAKPPLEAAEDAEAAPRQD